MQEQSLIEANLERATIIAEVCARRAERAGKSGAWHGYQRSEGLIGVLVQDKLMRYARPGHDNHDPNSDFATIFFGDPTPTEIERLDWGEEVPVEKDVVERYKSSITKIKGVEYDDKITHTFAKTKSLQEAFKLGAEIAIKAGFSYSGVSAEVSAKLTAEYSRQWGESTTQTDTVERTLILPADFEGDVDYEAVRSIDKVQREVKAIGSMEYNISFVSGPVIPPANHPYYKYDWLSLKEFIGVGRGFASTEHAMYHEFINYLLTPGEVYELHESGRQSVEFMLDYDKVNSQEIKIL